MPLTSTGIPRWAAPKMYSGNVTVVPELKLETTKSSIESATVSYTHLTLPTNREV